MYYEIIGVKIEYGKIDDSENLYPQTAICTIQQENGDPRIIQLSLGANRTRAVEVVLRHEVDALLNDEMAK